MRPREAKNEPEGRGTPETLAGVRVPQEVTDGAGASRVTCAAYQRGVQMSKNPFGALGMQVDRIKRVGGSGSAAFGASLLLVIWPYQGATTFTPCVPRDASLRSGITEWRPYGLRLATQKLRFVNGH